ncbi:MAG: SGNH/GDSL hydrolase family protein, partial [Mucilaginibacter sp.]
MNKSTKLLMGLLLAGSVTKTVNAQQVAPFRSGDRVAFLGNSITDGGHYHSYIWLYYMTHLPNQRLTILNTGIGGDDVVQMGNRLEEDVLPKKPNVIAFVWGMNDTGYSEWYKPDAKEVGERKLARSFASYNVTADKLAKLGGIRKILMAGSPYDENVKIKGNLYPGKAEAFAKVIDFQEKSAKQRGWELVDFYHPMREINKKWQLTDSLFSLTPTDRIHPDNDGHMVMAYLFLKAQGFANKPVADVVINFPKRRVEISTNAVITNMLGKGSDISFDYLAGSLPYPLDTIARGW